MRLILLVLAAFSLALHAEETPAWSELLPPGSGEALPGTTLLSAEGDLAEQLLDSAHAFLDRKLAEETEQRASRWSPDFTTGESYRASLAPFRRELASIIGLDHDKPTAPDGFEYHDVLAEPRAEARLFTVHPVRWRAFGEVYGTGLLFEPRRNPKAIVIAIPDAGRLAEEFAGLPPWERLPATPPVALQLAASGCRVLVPRLIDPGQHDRFALSNREWIHRPAFQLGRTLTGYEVRVILAAADRLHGKSRPLGIVGWGEGGRLALLASALDDRFHTTCVSGWFGPREEIWREPAERNLFGFLRHFGDAELAAMVAPRRLLLEHGTVPIRPAIPDTLGKPGPFPAPNAELVRVEHARSLELAGPYRSAISLQESSFGLAPDTMAAFLESLSPGAVFQADATTDIYETFVAAADRDWAREQKRQFFRDLEEHNEHARLDSAARRTAFFKAMSLSDPEDFQREVEPYRDLFREDIIGHFAEPRVDPRPRTLPLHETSSTFAYEVVLDVFPDFFVHGILTLPRDLDLTSGERRPVVVCQHGLEGKPSDLVGERRHATYGAFATRLAERGYITFAPQHLYLGRDRFRMLQFKANAIGKTLFSMMVSQHLQLTDWLAEQPWVDPERIAFYGLSYGGKSAMRIPPLVERYALSICSADFNDWIWKTTATDSASLRYSYVNKREYEIFEYNLGNTFNYAEMAALIAPRPFFVERGHFDGVAPDHRVAAEYARVRRLYSVTLGLPDHTGIEWFVGGHKIHGEASFRFLDRHLDWNPSSRLR